MITIENYFETVKNVNFDTLPEALRSGHRLATGSSHNDWAVYHSNENIHRVVDTYMKKLGEWMQKNSTKTKKKKEQSDSDKSNQSEPKVKKTKAPKEKKEKTKKDEIVSDKVEFISPELRFIKRFLSLHGKTKDKAQILSFINALQKAIVEKRIRKSSGYAKTIESIQDQLIECYNSMGKTIRLEFNPEKLEKYKTIAQSETVSAIVRFMKGVIAIQGKSDVKKRAESLYKSYTKAFNEGDISKDDPRYDETVALSKSLLNYLQETTDTVEINDSILYGLQGFLGESVNGLNGLGDCSAKCISSTSLPGMQFHTIGLQGKYRKLIGDPSVGFTAMVFGLPKSGKSTLCIDFAKHLAEHHGKVLYVAIEEGFGYTLKEKFERLHAVHPNLEIAEKIPSNLSNYDFAFIDSVSKAGMTIEDLVKLHKQFPKTAFIFIFHSTKDGKFRGGQGFAHEVDCIIDVSDGVAKGNGRFGVGGEINVF